MHDVSLSQLYDFIQVAYSMRKLYTNNYYLSKHILFTMINLLQEQNLNPRNYSEQKIFLIKFIQATGYEMYMYAKFEYLDVHIFCK
jgi:hypothetical protein